MKIIDMLRESGYSRIVDMIRDDKCSIYLGVSRKGFDIEFGNYKTPYAMIQDNVPTMSIELLNLIREFIGAKVMRVNPDELRKEQGTVCVMVADPKYLDNVVLHLQKERNE